jgi:hypothetical protein
MQSKTSLIEPLLERVEEFGKTSFELLKLKSVDKTADLSAILISRLLVVIILSIFVITLNIALAMWLGDLLGKNYYGFLIVASFYGLIGIGLYFFHPLIKASLKNFIITQMLK